MFVYGNENLFFPTPGAPVWLTTVGTNVNKGCIIATLADKSSIFAFGYREGSRVSHTVPSGGINPGRRFEKWIANVMFFFMSPELPLTPFSWHGGVPEYSGKV